MDPLRLYGALGSLCAAVALGCLYASWRSVKKHSQLNLLGWSGLFVSILLYRIAGGPDRGVAIGLIVISLLALGIVFIPALMTPGERTRPSAARTPKQSPVITSSLGTSIATFLLVSVAAAMSALTTAICLYQFTLSWGLNPANALVIELFLFPCAWAVLSAAVLMQRRWRGRLSMVLFPLTASSLALLLSGW